MGVVCCREYPDPGTHRTQPILAFREAATYEPPLHPERNIERYAALDIASGKVIGSLHARHRTSELLTFLRKIDAEILDDSDVHLVMDKASTDKTLAVKRGLTAH